MQGLWRQSSKAHRAQHLQDSGALTPTSTQEGLYPTEEKEQESGQPGHSFNPCCHLPAVWSPANDLTSLGFRFRI